LLLKQFLPHRKLLIIDLTWVFVWSLLQYTLYFFHQDYFGNVCRVHHCFNTVQTTPIALFKNTALLSLITKQQDKYMTAFTGFVLQV
jgi:hypothetical protein